MDPSLECPKRETMWRVAVLFTALADVDKHVARKMSLVLVVPSGKRLLLIGLFRKPQSWYPHGKMR